MRRAIIAALVVAAATTPASAWSASGHHDPCNTHACHVRVAHKQGRAKKIRVTAPYRGWLLSTRMCESGGDYAIVDRTGTYYGAYQFDLGSWARAGGRGMPHRNPPLEQDYRAVRWRLMVGTGAWPVCG